MMSPIKIALALALFAAFACADPPQMREDQPELAQVDTSEDEMDQRPDESFHSAVEPHQSDDEMAQEESSNEELSQAKTQFFFRRRRSHRRRSRRRWLHSYAMAQRDASAKELEQQHPNTQSSEGLAQAKAKWWGRRRRRRRRRRAYRGHFKKG
eukprot:TRINITY_DN11752_c0_g1_i4.p1 TRINITY_DN11752_c0_g1~~TRINITY_DN11752_c0_g1_i4.p1  ORF type:complete len:154 (+),score=22.16 TRINITY_DN11752_c0_g1_i4:125-586(+)